MANITNELEKIKNAVYGNEVRQSIHDGINSINEEVKSTTSRQVDLESTFDQLVINAGNSNAEIVDARVEVGGTSYAKLGDRLNKFDEQFNTINTQILDKTNSLEINKVNKGENESITLAMLSQEVKESISRGNVAVVGENSVNTVNIVDCANTLNKLDRAIIKRLYNNMSINIFDNKSTLSGKAFDSTGALVSSSSSSYSDYIPVIENMTLIKNGTFSLNATFYDANKSLLSSNFYLLVTNNSFVVPVGAYYMRVSTATTNIPTLMIVTNNEIPSSYVGHLEGKNKETTKNTDDIFILNNIIDGGLIVNLFNKNASDIIVGKYYNKDGVLSSASSYRSSGLIPIRGIKTIIKTGTYSSNVTFWNKNKDFISGLVITNGTASVPSDAYYVRVSLHMDYMDSYMLLNSNYLIDGYYGYLEGIPKFKSRTWKNKKMCTIGHSLTQMERWQPTVVKELGLSGYVSLATYGGFMINQICYNIADVPSDCDLITYWVGTNDYGNNKTLGTIEDIDEKTTFYGALKYVCEYASTNYPNKRLMFITDWQRDDSTDETFTTSNGVDNYGNPKNNVGNTLLDYVNAVIEVCGLYGIPVYDAYRLSGVNKFNLDTYSDDRLHPSISGGIYMGKKIAKFIESI